MKAIEINKLTKYYGKSRGIIDVSFSIEEGEIFGFIGPNGAGKSTTIRTLLNFIYPTGGSASIFGKDILKETDEIRKMIGYLPSEVHYYDDMKSKELLSYSASYYRKDCSKKIKKLAERLDLDLNKRIEDLSFGNRKKVGIIQALLHEPKLLILDEPTSGLDPLMQNIFFELLKEENKKGVTIFFSSHVLSEVQRMCERVAIIKEGRLIKVESIENLTGNQFKNVTVVFKNDVSDIDLSGIIRKEKQGNELKLLYNGGSNLLITELNKHEIKDLLIEEPTLEEIFMHYYQK
ncbi:MAG: ATP-binding cassette domain-containing protein [Bacillota bacterium]